MSVFADHEIQTPKLQGFNARDEMGQNRQQFVFYPGAEMRRLAGRLTG